LFNRSVITTGFLNSSGVGCAAAGATFDVIVESGHPVPAITSDANKLGTISSPSGATHPMNRFPEYFGRLIFVQIDSWVIWNDCFFDSLPCRYSPFGHKKKPLPLQVFLAV
jgi:hypothetical protein